jgi:hypothetical protein
MNFTNRTGALLCVAALVSVSTLQPLFAAPAPKTIIIRQENSPVEIAAYTAKYLERSQYTTEGIHHSLTYSNRGTQKVVAIRFGLVTFDVFNRFLGKTGGISMDDLASGKSEKGSWVNSPYADFSFLTGLAYVDMVRLEDGTIWQADEATVLDEIRKIEKDFDAKLLRERDGPPRGSGPSD